MTVPRAFVRSLLPAPSQEREERSPGVEIGTRNVAAGFGSCRRIPKARKRYSTPGDRAQDILEERRQTQPSKATLEQPTHLWYR
mgnify:CR=1 FL=1